MVKRGQVRVGCEETPVRSPWVRREGTQTVGNTGVGRRVCTREFRGNCGQAPGGAGQARGPRSGRAQNGPCISSPKKREEWLCGGTQRKEYWGILEL